MGRVKGRREVRVGKLVTSTTGLAWPPIQVCNSSTLILITSRPLD